MRGRLWIAPWVVVAFLVGGCADWGPPKAYEPITQKEREIFEIHYTSLTPAQRHHYLSLPTRAEREAYLKSLGILR